jgi:AAA domain-containing protein
MTTTPAGQTPAPTPGARDLRVVYLDKCRDRPPAPVNWLWHGYLAPRNITLLTSQWKSGKTTLLSVLLARLRTGGTLAGLPVRAGRAVVVSEEPVEHWEARGARLEFGDAVGFMCRPFQGAPTPEDWQAVIDRLVAEHHERPLDLVVIDALATFLPTGSENNAGTMLAALLPLQRLTALGVCVLILHHPRKAESAPGRAARGSGALTGHVDIVIEMDWVGWPQEDDRRRKLTAYSRHAQTTRRLVVELSADGTDYAGLGDFADLDQTDNWPVLLGVLQDADHKLTKRAIREQWPEDYERPSVTTLWRWLDRAVADGRVSKAGTGRRRDPFVYWLPHKAEEWANDPDRLPDPDEDDDDFDPELDLDDDLPDLLGLGGLLRRRRRRGGR